jgi:5-formyltetrahydrofolate cyclo-ligase
MTIADPAAAKIALRVASATAQATGPRASRGRLDGRRVAREPLAKLFPEPAGKVAALYHGLGSEVSPRSLADQLAEDGWDLALPAVRTRTTARWCSDAGTRAATLDPRRHRPARSAGTRRWSSPTW